VIFGQHSFAESVLQANRMFGSTPRLGRVQHPSGFGTAMIQPPENENSSQAPQEQSELWTKVAKFFDWPNALF